ncbi:hypothetical protein ACFL2V_04195 [Pseudomonadota bacterium]
MEKQKTKMEMMKFKTAATTVVLAVMLFFGNSLETIHAQPAATPSGAPAPEGLETETQEQVNAICQIEMQDFLFDEFKDYREFMDTHFQNMSGSSSLLDTAFAKYREFRSIAMREYATYFPQQGASQLSEGIEPGACLKIVEDTLADARKIIELKAAATSTVKKTTALITKYQEINAQLRVLTRTFLTMKGYFDTFSDKLPCYIADACNKS